MDSTSLKIGINLGGWISQYQQFDYAHFDRFILERDLQQIASWGMDHVRLPVDYPVIEAADQPGTLDPRGIQYLDNCLAWCQCAGLRLVLDLHKAPGYTFTNTLEAGPMNPNTLFSNAAMQERFINLWEALARHYLGQAEETLAFELLNEMVLPDSAPWNALARKTIDRLRQLDTTRLIVIGGNNYNAVEELQNIEVQADPHLLYTFHSYQPMVVTHQRAPWVKEMDLYAQTVAYPGEAPGLGEFLAAHPKYKPGYAHLVDRRIDPEILREALQPAVEFIQQTGQSLYCGEFGVIDRAPLQTRINWMRDFIEILNEYGIGRAIWSYKEMDFGLVDAESQVISAELVKAAVQPAP